jgi:REP element-mobilizing transposase RayT
MSRRSEWEALFAIEEDQEQRKRFQAYLDRGFGECWLRQAAVAGIVQESLWHFDGVRYGVLAWVIMPNHVHALFDIWGIPMADIMRSWKGFTARQANRLLGRSGAFWEANYFDTAIRDEGHLRRAIQYIENNPVKAGLVSAPDDWMWSSARYRGGEDNRLLSHPKGGVGPPRTS